MKCRAQDSTKRGKKEVFQCNFVPEIGSKSPAYETTGE